MKNILYIIVTICSLLAFFPLVVNFNINKDLVTVKYFFEISFILLITTLYYLLRFKSLIFKNNKLMFIGLALVFVPVINYAVFVGGLPKILHFMSSEKIQLNGIVFAKGRIGKNPHCLSLKNKKINADIDYCVDGLYYKENIYNKTKIGDTVVLDGSISKLGFLHHRKIINQTLIQTQ